MTSGLDNTQPIFEFRDVTYAYDRKQTAVKGISLVVEPGESLALLGANGSGKSTILKLMDGLYFPTSGSIRAFGAELSESVLADDANNFAFRRRVGLLFQDADVQLFSPTVRDEIAFAPLQLGHSQAETLQRVDAAMQALQITGLEDRPPHRLSGGEKRRVALASLLSLEPDVWLLDEPSSELDPRSQAWFIDFLLDQLQAGKTVVTATHDLTLVEAIASRVCVLDEAHQLAASGSPEEILTNAGLMRSCNLIHEHRHPHAGGEPGHRHPHFHYPLHDHHKP